MPIFATQIHQSQILPTMSENPFGYGKRITKQTDRARAALEGGLITALRKCTAMLPDSSPHHLKRARQLCDETVSDMASVPASIANAANRTTKPSRNPRQPAEEVDTDTASDIMPVSSQAASHSSLNDSDEPYVPASSQHATMLRKEQGSKHAIVISSDEEEGGKPEGQETAEDELSKYIL